MKNLFYNDVFSFILVVMAMKVNIEDYALQIQTVPPAELPVIVDNIILLVQSGGKVKLKEVIASLKNAMMHLLSRSSGLKEEKLNILVKDLQQRLERLETLERSLLIGQIALKLEKVLIDHILEDANVDKRYMTLEILDDAVTYGDSLRHCKGIFLSDNERQLAKDKWDMLQERLQLKSIHYRAIKALKVTRNTTVHSLQTVDKTIRSLKNQAGVDDIVFELLEMLKNMQVEDIRT